MNNDDSMLVREAFCRAAEMQFQAACSEMGSAEEKMRPSFLYRPRLALDGNKWICCFGDNIQEGVVGIGDSPDEAYRAFDKAWYAKVAA